MDYYYNYEPGRMRIRTPYIYHNAQNASLFENTVKGLNGMLSVETNAVTGSALMHFDEKNVNHQQIIAFLEKHGYFILAKAKTSNEVIEQTTEEILDTAEKIAINMVEGRIE